MPKALVLPNTRRIESPLLEQGMTSRRSLGIVICHCVYLFNPTHFHNALKLEKILYSAMFRDSLNVCIISNHLFLYATLFSKSWFFDIWNHLCVAGGRSSYPASYSLSILILSSAPPERELIISFWCRTLFLPNHCLYNMCQLCAMILLAHCFPLFCNPSVFSGLVALLPVPFQWSQI